MSKLTELWYRVLSTVRRRRAEHALDEEIRFHVDELTDSNLRSGMTYSEARRQALARFGRIERIKERARDEVRLTGLEGVLRDVRYGVRALRRSPSFAVLATVTLAVGIGGTTAVFTVVNAVLLKPLPYPDAHSLVDVAHTAPGIGVPGRLRMSVSQFFTYRDANRTFQHIGLWWRGSAIVAHTVGAEQVASIHVTDGTLQAVGITPLAGRWLSGDDDAPGAPPTVILTYRYWRARYGSDASIIGRTITIDSRPRHVIGIMPQTFQFPGAEADLILPAQFDPTRVFLGAFNFQGVARLKPGFTLHDATVDLSRMIPTWLASWPLPPGLDRTMFESARFAPALQPLKQEVVGDIGNVLWILMGTVGIVLLIACMNVASLLLARGNARQQELGVRLALGASHGRIVRQLLVENLVLGLLGGALGFGVAVAALRVFLATSPTTLPRVSEIGVDPATLWFTLGISLFSSLLFGSIPIIRPARSFLARGVRESARTATFSPQRHRTLNVLVVVQVALAVVLLVASGLMIRTFTGLRSVAPGFTEPDRVLLVRVAFPEAGGSHPEDVLRIQAAIRERMLVVPGVSAAAFMNAAPLQPDENRDGLFIEHRSYGENQVPPLRRFKFISPGYFQTLGIPIVTGRDITWTDIDQHRPVVVISENLAREVWRDPSAAIGKRIRESRGSPWREVVGVAADVRDEALDRPAPAIAYWPAMMRSFWGDRPLVLRTVTFAIRSDRAGTPALLDDIQRAIRDVNKGVPVTQVSTLSDVHRRSMARTSFTLTMLGIAATMALLLGVVGIYGVIGYAVAQRTREIAIRAALGAQQAQLRRMFVTRGLLLTAGGVVCGLLAATLVTRVMRSLLFNVDPLDGPTYLAVSLVLTATALLASYVPTRRATAANPLDVLGGD